MYPRVPQRASSVLMMSWVDNQPGRGFGQGERAAHFMEVVKLFWGDYTAQERPAPQMLPRTKTHADDICFPAHQPAGCEHIRAESILSPQETYPSLSTTCWEIRFPFSSQAIASGRTTSLTNLRMALWNRRWLSL